jgi:hypothetical protein
MERPPREALRGSDFMPSPKTFIRATLIFGLITTLRLSNAVGQTAAIDKNLASTVAVIDQPFSATKYHRTIKILSDGKQLITAERHSIQLARNSAGLIRIAGANPIPECDQPSPPALSPCPVENVFVFNPETQTITHWPEGERAGPEAVIIKLSEAQVEAAEKLTSIPDESNAKSFSDGENLSANLGQKLVEGVNATGTRTATTVSADNSRDSALITKIHEVWVSAQMKLVIRVIDGDPRNEETISGLENLSRQPDPALFQPPDGYSNVYTDQSDLADEDIRELADWFVR